MQVHSLQSNSQISQSLLICPVLLEPLSQAVSLVPCAHKVQQAAAEKLFGATHGGWQVLSNNRCPICKETVLGYMADHTIRNILTQMKKNLAEKSISVEKDVIKEMPYPGEPAKFIHTQGDWRLFDSAGADLCRYMEFNSVTENSLIKEFSVLGYKDGDVSISILFSKNHTDNLNKFLKQFDLVPKWIDLEFGYKSQNNYQLEIFFNILANNNEIPDSHFQMIRDLVTKGTHN